MSRRRFVVWSLLLIILLPTVMATADIAQRASDSPILFRLPSLHEGDRFVYDARFSSHLHGMDLHEPGYLTIDVKAAGPVTFPDGSTHQVLPITKTIRYAAWDSLAYHPTSQADLRGTESQTYYYGVDDGIMYGFHETEDRSLYTRNESNGTIVRSDRDMTREFSGSWPGILTHNIQPGAAYSNLPPAMELGLDLFGLPGNKIREPGMLDGERVFDVAWQHDGSYTSQVNAFGCTHAYPSHHYSDWYGPDRFSDNQMHVTYRTETWVRPDLAFPVVSECHTTYRSDHEDGRLLEEVHFQLVLAEHVEGTTERPMPWALGEAYEPRGDLEPAAYAHPTVPSDGADTPLRLPLEAAFEAVLDADDDEVASFVRAAGGAPLLSRAYFAAGQSTTAPGTSGGVPVDPGLPVGTPDQTTAPSETHHPIWTLTIHDQGGRSLDVHVTQDVPETGTPGPIEVEAVGVAGPATLVPQPALFPDEVVPLADVLRAWAETNGVDLAVWRDDARSGLLLSVQPTYEDGAVVRYVPVADIERAADLDTSGDDAAQGAIVRDHYSLLTGARERVEHIDDTRTFGERPPVRPANAGQPVSVDGGYVPTAAAASGLAVLLLFTLALFWDAVRAGGLKLIVLPMYAKISRDEVLDHETRDDIRAFVEANQGANFKEIRSGLALGHGTAFHHLATLERNGILTSSRVGRQRCYFTLGDRAPAEQVAKGLMKSFATRRVLEAIVVRPGVTQRELADHLDVTPKAVRVQVARLEEAGLVDAERAGRMVRYRSTSRGLAATGAASPEPGADAAAS